MFDWLLAGSRVPFSVDVRWLSPPPHLKTLSTYVHSAHRVRFSCARARIAELRVALDVLEHALQEWTQGATQVKSRL
jgi:hypothetical protein